MKKVEKYYLNDDGEATIICRQCGRNKAVSGLITQHGNKAVRVKCPCSAVFYVSFERRRHYRKKVRLSGAYRHSELKKEGLITVEDISLGGLCFRTYLKANDKSGLKADDYIHVNFTLDNRQRTKISRRLLVRSVREGFVSAEFDKDVAYDPELWFYLKPSKNNDLKIG